MLEKNKKHILIAEDAVDLREALKAALESSGEYKVTAVGDGEAAIAAAFELRPDHVLLDIKMAKKTGDEVLQALRADAWGVTVGVTLLTAQADLDTVATAIAAGGVRTSYLTKGTTSLAQVLAHVRSQLEK